MIRLLACGCRGARVANDRTDGVAAQNHASIAARQAVIIVVNQSTLR